MTFRHQCGPDRFQEGHRSPGPKRMHPLLPAALTAALALVPGVSQAASAQSFEGLAARLEDHPSVAALRDRAQNSEELAHAARALPDPTISLGVNNVPIREPSFDRFLPSNKSVGIHQMIPNGGVRRARSARERGQARQFDLQAAYRVSLLRAELIVALADKARIGGQIAHAQKQLELYGEMEEILRGELEAGRPIFFRLSEIDVERANVDRRLTDLRNELARADARLVQLVGEVADMAPPPMTLRRWQGDPHSLYPVRIADAGLAMAQANVREGKAEYGPDVGVSLQYKQREAGVSEGGMPFAGDDWFSAGISFSVPLWAAQNQAPRLRAARARESSAKASLHAVLRTTRERLTSLYSVHESAVRNIGILTAKEKSLRDLIEAARRNYEAGRGTYVQVLDGEIGLLTLLSQIEDERVRKLKAAAKANSHLVLP